MPTDHSKDSHSKTHTQASHARHEASDNRAKQAITESTARKQEVSDKAAADKKAKEVVSPVVSPVVPDTIPLQSLTAHVEGLQSRLGELESALTPDIESVSPDAKAALRRLGIEINALRHIRG